jgi:hypothetical protein
MYQSGSDEDWKKRAQNEISKEEIKRDLPYINTTILSTAKKLHEIPQGSP